MKSFKKFIKDVVEPILIPVAPCHGKHSKPNNKEEVKEGTHPESPINHPLSDKDAWHRQNDNHHLGKTFDDVDSTLENHNKDYSSHPSFRHVHQYTRESYSINSHLLEKASDGKSALQKSVEQTKKLSNEPSNSDYDRAFYKDSHNMFKKKLRDTNEKIKHIDGFLKDQKLPHDLHVYHGTEGFDPGKLASKHPKRLIKSAAYMSTSIKKHIAAGFAGSTTGTPDGVGGFTSANGYNNKNKHILHIHLKKGQRAAYLGSHSNFHEEHEALLPRNTTLKVHHEPTVLVDGTKVWHATVHNQRTSNPKVTSE